MAQATNTGRSAGDALQIGMNVVRRFTRAGETLEVVCEVVDPYSKEFSQLLECAPLFRKSVEVRVEHVRSGEVIYTEQSSTKRVAQTGDVLVHNPTGEAYLISAFDLANRYLPKPRAPGIYLASGPYSRLCG